MPATYTPQRKLSLQEIFERDGAPQGPSGDPFGWYCRHANVRATALYAALTTPAQLAVGEGYEATADSTEGWVQVADAPNFTSFDVGRVADGRLTEQPRGAHAESIQFEASAAAVRLHRYSREHTVDEVEIVNFESVQGRGLVKEIVFRGFGRAAREVRPDLIYSLLLSNPTLPDGDPLFHADHNNTFTGTIADLDSLLSEAAAAMPAQSDAAGIALGYRPDFIITGATLERDVRKQVREIDLISTQNTPAPVVRTDARIESGLIDPATKLKVAGSAATIFLASSVEGAGLVAGYLEGSNRRPMLLSWPLTQGRFGVGYAVSMYVAAGVVDYRGLARIIITE